VLGAVRARRTLPAWPWRPQVAAALGVVLLAVPVGGVVLYQQAQAEAVQRMLLGRLSQADQLVADTVAEPLVLDDEPLIALDPASGRGYRLTMSGVGDNHQLHTPLADRLLTPGVSTAIRPSLPG
jgi:hypothetical protein